jgi:predicted amidohydrolase YtcJ
MKAPNWLVVGACTIVIAGCTRAPDATQTIDASSGNAAVVDAVDATGVSNASGISGVAEQIYLNGKILSVDADFQIVEALATRGDRILAIGTNEEILSLSGPDTVRTDLGGRTVVPGLIDNHMHFLRATKDWYRHVRWDGVTSRAEALAMLSERSQMLPAGEWVLVIGGWTYEQFLDDDAIFTASELDQVLPDRPVYIQEGYRRGFANTAALRAAGIDPETVNFEGRGVMGVIEGAIAQVSAAQWDSSFQQTMSDLHAMGLTTVYDVGGNGVTPQYYESVARLAAAGELSMRVFYSLNPGAGIGPTAEEIVAALNSRSPDLTSLNFAQFGWGESTYGPMRATPWRISDEDLGHYEAIALAAAERGWQMHEHSMRNEKIDAMLGVFEAVNKQRPISDARWTIAHTNGISQRSIDRANALGMVYAVHSSNRLANPGTSLPPPIAMIHESGGVWGMGSDSTTVASPNPFHNIAWAVTGRSPGGETNLAQTVSREAALTAHTRSNGYILFREDHIGSLEAGKLADFAIIDRDYMTVPDSEIKEIRSLLTVVGGREVYTDREFARGTVDSQ